MSVLAETFDKLGILKELVGFFWHRKLWWMIPLIVVLVIFGVLIVVGSTTGIGPFVYTLF